MSTIVVGAGETYTTIQAGFNALASESPGSHMRIKAGTYNEEVTINSLAGLEGARYYIYPEGEVIISGQDTRDHCLNFADTCSYVTVDFAAGASNKIILEQALVSHLKDSGNKNQFFNPTIRDGDGDSVVQGIALQGSNAHVNTSFNIAIFAVVGINTPKNIYLKDNTVIGTGSDRNLACIGVLPTTRGKLTYDDGRGVIERIARGLIDENWTNRNTISAAATNPDILPLLARGMLA